MFCREQSLFGAELVAIDGAKFAAASRRQVMTPKRIERECAKLDERIAEYLSALDQADATEAALAADRLSVVADTGYSNGAHGKACEEAGITTRVPRAHTVNPKGQQYIERTRFDYDALRCRRRAEFSRRGSSPFQARHADNVHLCDSAHHIPPRTSISVLSEEHSGNGARENLDVQPR